MNSILPIVLSLIASFILGFIWYGPLFGKVYGRIIGMPMEGSNMPAKKTMVWLYVLNAIATLITLFVMAMFIPPLAGLRGALIFWVGFVMPTIASQAIWSGKPAKDSLYLFLISAGYQLIAFVIYGLILGNWQ